MQAPWAAWQEHMTQLFQDFLVSAPARVIWKEHAPQHFEGPLGIDPKCVQMRSSDSGPPHAGSS